MESRDTILSKVKRHMSDLESALLQYEHSYSTDTHYGKRYVDLAEHAALELVDVIRMLPTEHTLGENITALLRPTHGHKKTREAIAKAKAVFKYVH